VNLETLPVTSHSPYWRRKLYFDFPAVLVPFDELSRAIFFEILLEA